MNKLQCRLPDDQKVYSDKLFGESLATEFMFDIVDLTKFNIEIFVPENTFTITDSFFIGLLEKLYFKIDDRKLFCEKVRWFLPLEFTDNRIKQLVDRLEYQLTTHKKIINWYPIDTMKDKNNFINRIKTLLKNIGL